YVMYFKSTLRVPFTSLSIVTSSARWSFKVFSKNLNSYLSPPRHPQVLLLIGIHSLVQITTLHQGICKVNIWRKRNCVTKLSFVSQFFLEWMDFSKIAAF